MSSIVNSVKNAFKHPEEESEGASGYGRESQRYGDSSINQGTNGQQQTASDLQYDESQRTSTNNPVEAVQASVPSTGYVGDNTGGRFPGQRGYSSNTSQSDTFGAQSNGSGNNDSSSDDSQITSQDYQDTGREGVPGTVTSGDPSMGGKYNSATAGSERSDVYEGGDPSMGNKYTRAEGIN